MARRSRVGLFLVHEHVAFEEFVLILDGDRPERDVVFDHSAAFAAWGPIVVELGQVHSIDERLASCHHIPRRYIEGMTEPWHRPLTRIGPDALSGDTGQTVGMTRFEAISNSTVGSEKLWMGRTHVAPYTSSGNHHHGETETAIYVVAGHPVFVFASHAEGTGEAREVRLETSPGDFVFVPPMVAHREENPTGEEAVVVIARSSQEAVVVNLPSLT